VIKKILCFVSIFLFLFACNGGKTPPISKETKVNTQLNYFYPKYHNPIAIFPTYKFLGTKTVTQKRAYREYHLWEESSSGKYILISAIYPVGSKSFKKGIRWINKDSAIYVRGNVAAFTSIHPRAKRIIEEMGAILPNCFILAQEFYLDKERREAIYKVLISPDEMCDRIPDSTVEELNRVANMQP